MLALVLSAALQPAAVGVTANDLWQAWPEERYVTTAAPCFGPAELDESLRALADRHPGRLRIEEVGRSFEGRPVSLMTLGRGARKVLLWSQMHGDEPSATPALLDIADYLLSHPDDPTVAAILDGVTLLMVPMLNPDGAERYERRNAQGIDINRDALNLATPEGRLLKRLRDEHRPMLGFNLHDQNRRTAVGDSGELATNAVLAVAGDPEGTVTPGRLRAKRACAAIVEALAPFVPGGMARYDEEWSPRAFGDNLTAWGTPVVLIESGGLPVGFDFPDLTRLNFVAILAVLQDLVRDDLAGYDPETYEALLRNEDDAWADVVVRDGLLLQPGMATPYRADLAFDLLRGDRQEAGCRVDEPGRSTVVEVGDARFIGAGREIDASDSLVLAPFVVGVRGWAARGWLDGGALVRLARSGVGAVRWIVEQRRAEDAARHARDLEGGGGAVIEVSPVPTVRPWLMLTRMPEVPESNSLDSILTALGGDSWRRQRDAGEPIEVLQRLWLTPGGRGHDGPQLRPRQPASFLVVSPAPAGELDLGRARLISVWMDGVEVLPHGSGSP